MIQKEELKNYAKVAGLKNLGQAEKDYIQNIILFILYQEYGNTLIFKGGTALKKCYGLNRFSEDLDFTCVGKVDTKKLESGLKRFGIEYEIETKEYENGLKIILRITGPLYLGVRHSICNFIIDFSFRENVTLKPLIKTVGRFIEELPEFDVLVMDEREILAEKVRAIMSRTKARDVYDLWFLLEKGVSFDKELTDKKLEYYRESWSPGKFEKHLNLKEAIWNSELDPLIPMVPEFKSVKKSILEKLKATRSQ
ncbi:MAG: nucleotidyl transferase AbiEii/AbiGii toxin family protein [Candidatus Aenigmarchaeota archaeon]|nr:nucleotidyl transferase AbiEii/AbiGii toxin family protein [Candidatus Aenigmarchaeota archaeon]